MYETQDPSNTKIIPIDFAIGIFFCDRRRWFFLLAILVSCEVFADPQARSSRDKVHRPAGLFSTAGSAAAGSLRKDGNRRRWQHLHRQKTPGFSAAWGAGRDLENRMPAGRSPANHKFLICDFRPGLPVKRFHTTCHQAPSGGNVSVEYHSPGYFS